MDDRTTPLSDFAAIDFETANRNPASVCSVGVVVVRNGSIAEEMYALIRPAPNYYSPFNTAVHGLTRSDTDAAPLFPAVWATLAPHIGTLPLAAHFARFDESCLRGAFAHYAMPWPGYRFYCTCVASRKVFGRTLPNHKLPTVAARCGVALSHHHHALDDARACALIGLALLEA